MFIAFKGIASKLAKLVFHEVTEACGSEGIAYNKGVKTCSVIYQWSQFAPSNYVLFLSNIPLQVNKSIACHNSVLAYISWFEHCKQEFDIPPLKLAFLVFFYTCFVSFQSKKTSAFTANGNKFAAGLIKLPLSKFVT